MHHDFMVMRYFVFIIKKKGPLEGKSPQGFSNAQNSWLI